jgi:hypothetical protein
MLTKYDYSEPYLINKFVSQKSKEWIWITDYELVAKLRSPLGDLGVEKSRLTHSN